jgi:two-component system sensor histidine kinase DevS
LGRPTSFHFASALGAGVLSNFMRRLIDVELAGLLLSAAPDAMMIVDGDGVILLANDAATTMFRASEESLVDSAVELLVPDDVRAGHAGLRESYTGEPTRRPMGIGLQLQGQRCDGSRFPVEISLSPVDLDGVVMTIAAVRDVSDRQETMERIALLRDRERIGRDIHDMVIQRIFAAGMSLQAVVGSAGSQGVRDRLNEVTDSLDETIRQLRQAIFEIGQADERQSLSSQLASIVVERGQHLGFVPELSVVGQLDDLPDFVADQLIATLTESLSNVARHAEATEAYATIECTEGQISLVVEDNGVGIARSPKTKGGLSNMMWRAAELGGSCAIEANEPSGTRLRWEVPLPTAHKR